MREEQELKKDIDSARQAEAIINHPLYIASFELLKHLTQEKFKFLDNADTLSMQECNLKLKLIDEFEENLLTVISNGESAFETLESIQEFKEATKK